MIKRSFTALSFVLLISLTSVAGTLAQDGSSPLVDVNGDGVVVVMGFGDSITYGVGDNHGPGEFIEVSDHTDGSKGYLSRISSLGGLATLNRGVSGEFLSIDGIDRIPDVVAASNADIVVFMEGANDSTIQLNPTTYRILVQKAINVIRAQGRIAVVMTNPLPCCNRKSQAPFIDTYNSVVEDLAHINGLTLVDLEHTWTTTCQNKVECELYNIPDGIHPNTLGYDAMGQTILASLFGINIFAETGAADLESALSLPQGSVIVKPDVVPPL